MKTKTKQSEQEQNQRNGHHTEEFQWGGEGRNRGEKVRERRSMVSRHKAGREEIKNGMGNRGLKELTCKTHGCGLRGGGMLEGWGAAQRGDRGGKIGKTVIA